MKKTLIIVLVLVFALSLGSMAQCAMCRVTVSSNLSEGRGGIGTGLNFGIIYLFVFPYLLVGSLIFLWYRTGKKELKERQALEARMLEIYKK